MIKDYNVPLNAEQRHKIRYAMETNGSMAEITKEATAWRVVNYLMEDKPSLERYLTDMAGAVTKQRRQISRRLLIGVIFHAKRHLSQLDYDFQVLFKEIIDREQDIQRRLFVAENHLQININSDIWIMYERYGDTLRQKSLDFTFVNCRSLHFELKCFHQYTFERTGKVNTVLFSGQCMALNALTEINPRIRYFADITDADAKALLLFLENTYRKRNGDQLSQDYIAKAMKGVRRVVSYLMSDWRDSGIEAPRPFANPFAAFSFKNLHEYYRTTPVIPEDVIEQINKHSDEMPHIHKLLYDIFTNTGLRLKEVFFLEVDCIEDSRYEGINQLRFKPYKVLASRRRHGVGDCHRIMIPKTLADRITRHINETMPLREDSGSSYIFLSHKPGSSKALMTSRPFYNSVRSIVTKYDIRDENGELWHLTSKQFRKTVAVTLIENGATTEELAYWLGHMCSATAAKYYADVRKMKLAELNTRFFEEKFDLILSWEQLERYTEEERKLLYVDFRLEQRRVELGYCLVKTVDGQCSNRSSLYNCVNCKNLCTGKKYLPYWNGLLSQQEEIVERLIHAYHANGIGDYTDFAEYKQELRLLKGYESIVNAIMEGGA
jgi:integrase